MHRAALTALSGVFHKLLFHAGILEWLQFVYTFIYLIFYFFGGFFFEFLGREGGERKIRDCSVNFQPWALSQMRSAIPNFAFLERFFFFFFHFPQGREDFPTEPINTFCWNELFVLSVLKWRNPVWKHCLGSEIWDSV